MILKITDIAKHAGVSPSAVSRVIHNSGYVSDEKREIIEKTLKELNYVPNRVARGLKNQKTGMIGHILLSPSNPFFNKISQGLDLAAYEKGYHVLTLGSYNDAEIEKYLVNEMMSRRVDGIVFSVAASDDNVKKAIDMGIPTVMIERPSEIIGIDKVLVDNFEASFMATRYLIEKNHRKIAYIGKKSEYTVEKDRFQGYMKAMSQYENCPLEGYIQFVDDYFVELGFEAAKKIFQEKERPTAIFITSDILACGVLQFLYESKIRVPEDISIVGYDDTYASSLSPKLTVAQIPMLEMGKTAAELLLDKLNNKSSSIKTVTLHASIIERDSVKAL